MSMADPNLTRLKPCWPIWIRWMGTCYHGETGSLRYGLQQLGSW